jgi:hypothetical protein
MAGFGDFAPASVFRDEVRLEDRRLTPVPVLSGVRRIEAVVVVEVKLTFERRFGLPAARSVGKDGQQDLIAEGFAFLLPLVLVYPLSGAASPSARSPPAALNWRRCSPRADFLSLCPRKETHCGQSGKETMCRFLDQCLQNDIGGGGRHYSGLSVVQMQALRSRCARLDHGAGRQESSRQDRSSRHGGRVDFELMRGPTLIAYSDDPVAAPKAAVAFAKNHDKLVILGGAMGATALNVDAVRSLATLPSLDELRAKLVGLIQAPAGGSRGLQPRRPPSSRAFSRPTPEAMPPDISCCAPTAFWI